MSFLFTLGQTFCDLPTYLHLFYGIFHAIRKHCKNRKMLLWEHHIGCQMCQIAIYKSNEQVFFTVVRKFTQHFHKKMQQGDLFFLFFFLNAFGKSNLTHSTTDMMFLGHFFAILAMFLWRGCVICQQTIFFRVAWFV